MLLIKKYDIFKIYTYFLFKGLFSISSSESLKVVSISLNQTLFAMPKIKKIRWCVLRLTIFRENVPILSIPVPEGNLGSIGSKILSGKFTMHFVLNRQKMGVQFNFLCTDRHYWTGMTKTYQLFWGNISKRKGHYFKIIGSWSNSITLCKIKSP